MRFGSVCSGIEAASVAWHPLGWQAWVSEIEPFPSAVLAHHYPGVPNLGDMTLLPEAIRTGAVLAPDILCGGTPCQAFSVAGLRQSLDDARGNLSLTFCEIANAIDAARDVCGESPAIVFWENVPGVLSTKDNAFGCFLAGLAGEAAALVPPGGKWAHAGVVFGPTRAVAWRILDAQYFGLAQRRRRVFVVASARDKFDPAAVLFEFDGVRRDTAPRRETGKVAPTIPARSTSGGGLGTDFDLDGGVIAAQPYAVANCLTARMHKGINSTLDEGQTPVVTHAIGWSEELNALEDCQPTIQRGGAGGRHDGVAVHCRPVAQTITGNYGKQVDSSDTALGPNIVAFHPTQDPISSTDGSTHAMGCGSSGGTATVAVAVALRGRDGGATAELGGPLAHALRASSGGGDKPHVLTAAFKYTMGAKAHGIGYAEEQAPTLDTKPESNAVLAAMQVRRLTPVECERLQGFPDGYTAIPWRKKAASECPDGPRYKALGNSWAVPVVRWIGARIDNAVRGLDALEDLL